jgi:hypothetical protein
MNEKPINEKSMNLYNVNNYNKELKYDLNEMIKTYDTLMVHYLKYIEEQNLINNKYMVNKGIVSLTNIFRMILLYTKNLNLAFYQSQKAYYYYIEFIEQIRQDKNAFLRLNVKDAIMFIYKKTIYNVNDEYIKGHKMTNEEKQKFDILHNSISSSMSSFYV